MLQGWVQKTQKCFIWGLFLLQYRAKIEFFTYCSVLHGLTLCFQRINKSSQVKSQCLQARVVWSSSICMFKLVMSSNVELHFSHLYVSWACFAFLWTFKPVSFFAIKLQSSHLNRDEMSVSCEFSSSSYFYHPSQPSLLAFLLVHLFYFKCL